MLRGKLQYVKSVTAKGRRYEYFDTGRVNARGRPVLARLPGRSDPSFGTVYAGLLAGRTRRANVAAELTVPAIIDRYERSPEFRRLAASTQTTYGFYLAVLRDAFPGAPARDLLATDIVLLRDRMADRPGAANAMVATTSALYRWARSPERNLVEHNPAKDVARFDSKDYEPWPDDLLDAALASRDSAIALPVALLYYTAQRIGDVCALRWNDIRDGYLYLRQRKTRKDMEIRLHRELEGVLARAPRLGMTILADNDGRQLRTELVRERLQQFAADRGYRVVPHGLRKNAVNALLEAGNSTAETAAVSGQSLQMIEHYAKRRSGRRLSSAAILRWEAKS